MLGLQNDTPVCSRKSERVKDHYILAIHPETLQRGKKEKPLMIKCYFVVANSKLKLLKRIRIKMN